MRVFRRFFNYTCLLILVALSIQFSGYDCAAEELPNNIDGIEAEYLQVTLSAANQDSDRNVPDQDDFSDEHLCPCHLSFVHPLTTSLTSVQETTKLLILPELLLAEKISNSIFQPPKQIL